MVTKKIQTRDFCVGNKESNLANCVIHAMFGLGKGIFPHLLSWDHYHYSSSLLLQFQLTQSLSISLFPFFFLILNKLLLIIIKDHCDFNF